MDKLILALIVVAGLAATLEVLNLLFALWPLILGGVIISLIEVAYNSIKGAK